MEGRKPGIMQRLAQEAAEGHDNLGAFELTLGGAILVGYLFFGLLTEVTGWAKVAFWLLFIAGLWCGGALEYSQLRALGRRRFRGTLLLLVTWLTIGLALLLSGLLTLVVHLRSAGFPSGWRGGPVFVTLAMGFYHLSQGIRLGVRRWAYLGGALCLLGAVIPFFPFLRENPYLSCAFLLGGPLLVSGYQGRQTFLRRERAAQSL